MGTLGGGAQITQAVTFNTPFSEIPTVIASASGIYSNTTRTVTVTMGTISRAGFSCVVKEVGGIGVNDVVLTWNAEA